MSEGVTNRKSAKKPSELLNDLFTSDSVDKILEFYSHFEDREQLIQWMRERPKGRAHIYEVEGNRDVIVVIPTANFNGKYARECRENIFTGLHIIFVESGGIGDLYFNYAHNCNVGIKKAMEYNPKWIILSNDDMYKIDPLMVLLNEIDKLDPDKLDVLFAKQRKYVTQTSKLAERRVIFKKLIDLSNRKMNFSNLENKFGINLTGAPCKGLLSILYKRGLIFKNFVAFAIFSSNFGRNLEGEVFDETYLNAAEDTDLSIRAMTDYRWRQINFEIGALKGTYLGMNEIRRYKEIPSNAYLNYKIETGKLKISKLTDVLPFDNV